MAPTVETHAEKKKSGIRRLLSPVIFSGEAHRRKEPLPDTKIAKLTKHAGEVKETAFIGTSQIPRTKVTRKTRSQSLSPVRYGSSRPKVEGGANAASKNVSANNCYAAQGIPKTTLERRGDRQSDANRNYPVNLLQMKMQPTNNNVSKSGVLFSSASSSPTLAYNQSTNIRRGSNQQTVIKEQKLRPKIDPHDYETKKGHVTRFLGQGHKVKVTIMFRGREQSRPEQGVRLLARFAEDIREFGNVESNPTIDGRNMVMIIGPTKSKVDAKAEQNARRDARRAANASTDAAAPSAAPAAPTE